MAFGAVHTAHGGDTARIVYLSLYTYGADMDVLDPNVAGTETFWGRVSTAVLQ